MRNNNYVFIDNMNSNQIKENVFNAFEEVVNKNSENIALYYEGVYFTYKQLYEKSIKISLFLLSNNISKGDKIAVLMDRSPDSIACMLGIMRIGAIYVPVDSSYPIERIEYIIKDSNSNLIIINENSSFSFSDKNTMITTVECIYKFESDNDYYCMEVSLDDIAYIIYTSGTTGKPKGAMIEHRGIINLAEHLKEFLNIEKEDRIAQFASHSFDASIFEIVKALLNGAVLYIIPNYIIYNFLSFKNYINTHKITCVTLSPPYLQNFKRSDFKYIKHLIVAGSSSSIKLVEEWKDVYINAYGPTETTVCATMWKYKEEELYGSIVPIGKEIKNTKILILDDDGNIQKDGDVGQISVLGVGLSRGYFNKIDITNEKFKNLNSASNERIYLTGDLGRKLPDGNVEFLGRKDNQIKMSGYRIEPEEIENTLLDYSGIEKAVIKHFKDSGEGYLCAYIVISNHISISDIKQYLYDSLPNYMVPSHIRIIEEIPLTHNGKVDMKSLISPLDESGENNEYQADSVLEKEIYNIWIDVLKVKSINIDSDFFELGGNSLKATILISRIQEKFNKKIKMSELFKSSMFKDFIELIHKADEKTLNPVTKLNNTINYKASISQERIYRLVKYYNLGVAYNIPICYRIKGEIDYKKLENSINEVIQCHDILRSNFFEENNQVYQKINEVKSFNLKYKYFENITFNEVISNMNKEFDLNKDILFDTFILDIDGEKYLFFNISHAIVDGISVNLIMSEIFFRYNNNNNYIENSLSFKDYSHWESKNLDYFKNPKLDYFWNQQMYDLKEPTVIPYDNDENYMTQNISNVESIVLDKEMTMNIYKYLKSNQITLHMFMLSIYSLLINKLTGKEDVSIFIPTSGRTVEGTEKIIGMFVNTLPIRNYPGREIYFDNFIQEVKGNLLNIYDNQQYPFEEVINITSDKHASSISNLFMNINDVVKGENFVVENGKFDSVKINNSIAKFDFTLNVNEIEDNISLEVEYKTDLFKEKTIISIVKRIEYLIDQIVNKNINIMSELNLLNKNEIKQLTKEYNKDVHKLIINNTIIDKYEENVELYPESIAIKFQDKSYTYSEVEKKVKSLCHELINKGIKEKDVVAVIFDRSIEMIISILAILKMGAIYLPINPNHPHARKDYILKDSDCRLILTNTLDEFSSGIEHYIVKIENLQTIEKFEISTKITPYNIAYIIYTSGTTGNPKGVMVTHDNLLNLIENLSCIFKLNNEDDIFMKTNAMFDVSISEIFTWMNTGSTLIIGEIDIEKDPSKIYKVLCENDISFINFTPSMLWVFLEYLESRSLNIPESLKYCFSAGEELTNTVIDKFYKLSFNTKLVNLYGPTETTVFATYKIIDKKIKNKEISIGTTLNNYSAYIINENNNVLPRNTIGELVISGKGVSKGYLNNKNLNDEKFIRIRNLSDSIIYKTGDLAKWNDDGEIIFLGRKDDQIKRRGHRIEIGEIKNTLQRINYVKESSILYLENKLIAVFTADSKLEINNLKNLLAQYLPTYMIPDFYFQIEDMPKLDSGKINIKELKNIIRVESVREIENPRNKTEQEILEIWKSILKTDVISIKDDFFEIGGNSISAISLLSRIYNKYNILLDIDELFNDSSIEKIAALILSKNNNIFEELVNHLRELYDCKLSLVKIEGNKQLILQFNKYQEEVLNFIFDKYGIKFIPNYCIHVKEKFRDDAELIMYLDENKVKEIVDIQVLKEYINDVNYKYYLTFDNYYECGPGQNKIFKKNYNDTILNEIDLTSLNEENIRNVVKEVNQKNPLLRSRIIKKDDGYYFEEFANDDKYSIFTMDLTRLNEESKIKSISKIKETIFSHVSNMNKLNNILYRQVLLKMDNKNYKIISAFSHLIFDGASNNIYRRKILNELNNNFSSDNIYSYQDYIRELKSNSNQKKISEYLKSDKYKEIISNSSKKSSERNLKEKIIKLPLIIQDNLPFSEEQQKLGISLWYTLQLSKKILNKNKITFRITNNGREIGGKNFKYILGDCHVHFPLLLNAESLSITDCIRIHNKDYNFYYFKEKLYLEYLSYGDYFERDNEIERMYDNLDVVFNYIGEMNKEMSKEYCELINNSDNKYKTLYAYVHTCENEVILNYRIPESEEHKIQDFIHELKSNKI